MYTASAAAFIGEPERPSYAIAKSGITALARHVASRWGKEDIRANAIAPGLIMTAAVAAGTMAGHVLASVPSTRLGEPEDIAAAVAFLLSDDAGVDQRPGPQRRRRRHDALDVHSRAGDASSRRVATPASEPVVLDASARGASESQVNLRIETLATRPTHAKLVMSDDPP